MASTKDTVGWVSRLLLVAACASGAFYLSAIQRERFEMPETNEAAGSNEDPGARDHFDWLRFHDPATGVIPDGIREQELAFAAKLPKREEIAALSKSTGVAALSWNSRGPYNVGGRTRAIAVDVTNQNVLLAGGVSGGMWRSTNAGSTWSNTTTSQQLESVTCIVQDTRAGKTNIWYYGTGELLGNSPSATSAPYRGNGIYKSTDGGQSWSVLPATASNMPDSFASQFDYVFALAIDPSNTVQDELYAATIETISRSTDGGTSWTTVLGGFSNTQSRYSDVAVTSTGVVYATMSDFTAGGGSGATSRGIWRSPDGVTWTPITAPSWPTDFRRTVIGVAPSNQNIVYFLAETPGVGETTTYSGVAQGSSFWKYDYLSGDGSGAGGAWINRSLNLPNGAPQFGQPVGDFVSQQSYDLVVKVKPDDTNAVFIGGTNLYRSTNGFATNGATTWIGGYAVVNNVSQYSNHHPDQHGLVFAPNNTSVLYSSHDGGISVTSNCLGSPVSWTSLDNGFQTTQFYSLAIDHGTPGSAAIIGGMQDNGTWGVGSTAASALWSEVFGGDGGFCHINDGQTIYIFSYVNGATYRRQLSSGAAVRIDPTGGAGYLFINPFAVDPNNNAILYFSGGTSLWRNGNLNLIPFDNSLTTTKSAGWTNLSAAAIPSGTISALAVSKNPADRLYYGSSGGAVFRLDNASAATTSTTSMNVTDAGFPGGGYVSCIAVDPTNADNALVVFSNYNVASLFHTSNGGTSWTNVEGNLAGTNGPSARWASIVPYIGTTTYFLATSTGAYSCTALNGASTVWAQEGAATIGNAVVDMIDSRPSDGLVAAATHGRGVFSANLVSTSVAPSAVPSFDALYQNYPNPFNPSTTIRFRLASSGMVSLKVYALNGGEVATLARGDMSAGEHTVTWSADGLASGVYFYRLLAGDFLQTRSLMLLK